MLRLSIVALLAAGLSGCAIFQRTPPEAIAFARAVYVVDDAPLLALVDRAVGDSVVTDTLREGGFSGLFAIGDTLFAVTDRGPNVSAAARASGGAPPRVFLVPDYAPTLYRITLSGTGSTSSDGQQLGRAEIAEPVPLRNGGGEPASGRPMPGFNASEGGVEIGWADAQGTLLPPDPWGMDVEGATAGSAGKPARYGLPGEPATFWVAEEYRPALLEVERATGNALRRYTPRLADAAFDQPLDPVLGMRAPNLGFEGLARLDDGRLIAAMQAPLPNPDAASTAGSQLVRFVVFDPATGLSNTLAYQLDRPGHFVSDIAAARGPQILVLEHDGRGRGWVYAADLARGTLVQPDYDGRTLEQLGDDEDIESTGLKPVPKRMVLDLRKSGWDPAAGKPEGLAALGARTLVLISDNDYELDDDAADGTYAFTPRPTTLYTFRLPVPLWDDEDEEAVRLPLLDGDIEEDAAAEDEPETAPVEEGDAPDGTP